MFVRRLKLRPPQLLSLWMKRARLEQRLSPETRVVSIVAGPGYGKTVLAARFYSAWNGPKLWYSLDAADADLAVLASHMDTGIRALGIALPEFDASSAGALGSPKEIASRFAEGLAESPNAALLVFDDVQVLEKSRSLAALNELIKRGCQGTTCFVLSGRSMPVSLGTVAAAAQLAAIAASDLAFSDDETLAYLRLAVQEKVSDALVRLAARAEGWAAGLSLIASSARKAALGATRSEARPSDEASMPPASSDEMRHFLFDYLASEVLAELTTAEREFLLDTSILEQLEVELCDAVAGATGSRQVLASFTDRGLFVARRSDEAYTYHQLFREFLRHNLERVRPAEQVAALHRRAAAAFAARGDARQAISHYLDAGDTEAAVSAFEAAALDMLRLGLISSVDGVLRRIHSERIRTSPILLAVLGRVQRERGEWDNALQTLDLAIAGARVRQQFDVLAEAVRTCAPILGSRGEFGRLRDMLDEALSSSLQLPESSLSSLRMTLAAIHVEADELDEALAIYRDITPLIVARGDLAANGLVLHNTGVAHLRRGDVYTGLSLYERALKLKEQAGQPLSMLTTLGDLIYVKTLLGDLDEADRLVEILLSQAADIGVTHLVTRALEQQGSLKLLRGDVDSAQEVFRRAQASADPADMILMPEIEHGLAKCAMFKRNFADADALCARTCANLSSLGRRHQQLAPILITRAQVLAATGDVSMAIKLADESIVECAQGTNALVQATTCLEAAAMLATHATKLRGNEADRVDRRAAEAATTALALVHQRDYRFLLHTKADVFERLRPHLRRWGIGSELMPEQKLDLPRSLRIEALGGLRVFVDGEEVPSEAWKRRRAQDVFAYLFCQRGRAVARARLVDLWWPESDADAAHDSLRVAISAIRKVVGDVIKYEANAYRFVAPQTTVIDVVLFDEFLDQARQFVARGDAEQARRGYMAAVDLYGGDFLEGMQEGGWQWHERERLRAACIEALRWIAKDREAAHDATGLRLAVERVLEVAPFDLEAVRMRLDALVGEMRLAEAEQDYAAWRARYRVAVGADAPDFWKCPEPVQVSLPRSPVPTAG